ncbi:MAG TPA: pyridoxal-dependent decarboxylase [Steroidobacteraceae bacterium]|jgi:glutamate/tyrosine decarboxylase-like PLP-dependent enzyme
MSGSGARIAAPVAALFPPAAERERIAQALVQELAAAAARVAAGPVTPTLDMQQLRRELEEFDFEVPRSLETLLPWTLSRLEHGLTHLTHPRYFGLFNPAPTFPAQLADHIVASFNPQLASVATSPAAVAIEAHVIAQLAARAGLPAGSRGHFTTSGSEANATALICALTRLEPRFGSEGVRAFAGTPTVYLSEACQPGWFKVAHQCGIGRGALRLIGTDGSGRLDAAQLAERLARDRAAGDCPVMVAPTAGTTGAGMIDPLQRCAELAREYGAWFHVDAAWGGALLCSPRLRTLLAGIEQADSLTIDAHKWFAATMGCGMFVTRHAATAAEAFRVSADFMQSSSEVLDPYLTTLQWSRRFMGLRLFLSLAAAGWEGYAAHVERAVALIEELARLLTALGWRVRNEPRLAVLCAAPPQGSAPVRQIVQRVLRSGNAWVAATRFEGEDAVRICATHGESSERDLQLLVAALEQARAAQG